MWEIETEKIGVSQVRMILTLIQFFIHVSSTGFPYLDSV